MLLLRKKLQAVLLVCAAALTPAAFGYADDQEIFTESELPEYGEPKTPNDPDDAFAWRSLIIYSRSCKKCFEAALTARSATEKLVANDERWADAFVYLDKDENRAEVNEFAARYFERRQRVPDLLIVFVDDQQILRRFEIDCSTPLDVWSLAWLYKGIDERPTPPEDTRPLVRYPLTGGWWSVDGDWNPTREKIIRHLHDASLHTGAFEMFWLELLTYEELQSVHTDHHLELTRRGKVKWDYVNKQYPPGQTPPAPVPPAPPSEDDPETPPTDDPDLLDYEIQSAS